MRRLVNVVVRCFLISALALALLPARVKASPASMITIPFTSSDLGGIGLYQAGNRVYVGDTANHSIHVLDGTTNQQVAAITGLELFEGGDIVINETYGKGFFYYGTGYNYSWTAEIDLKTNTVVSTDSYAAGYLIHDEQHDKLYIIKSSAADYFIDTVDIASGAETRLYNGTGNVYDAVLNPVTQELALCVYYPAKIIFINVTNGHTSTFDVAATGGNHALRIEVNPVENKYYETLISVPGQGEMGIFILDRDTNAYKFVGASDLEPLVFNPDSDTLFSGVQVGTSMGIVDGKTDQFTKVDVKTNAHGGHGAGAVVNATDHAYFVSQNQIAMLDNLFKTVDFISLPIAPRGGLIGSSVVVNQSNRKVYVIADQESGLLFILQDTPSSVGNLVQDGSFESGTPDANWRAWASYDPDVPLFCTPALCGLNGAHAGSAWASLGGWNDETRLSQTGVIPVGKTHLTFWLQIPHAGTWYTSDVLTVVIDGKDTLFSVSGNKASSYPVYKKISLDIRRYADGKPHRIEFYAEAYPFPGTDPGTLFSVDQVSVETLRLFRLPMVIRQ